MSNPHFEHQLYGPDNTYFYSIFPPTRRFAIIPQALLRRAIKQGRMKDLNVSTGSTGATHYGRNSGLSRSINIVLYNHMNFALTGNSSQGKAYPDFFAVKVLPTAGDSALKPIRKHFVVCVMEIKLTSFEEEENNEVDELDELGHEDVEGGEFPEQSKRTKRAYQLAEQQMYQYMQTLINHPYRDPNLRGYLIVGSKYLEFQINGDKVDYTSMAYRDMMGPGDPLTMALCEIAVKEWNRSSENAPNPVPQVDLDADLAGILE